MTRQDAEFIAFIGLIGTFAMIGFGVFYVLWMFGRWIVS